MIDWLTIQFPFRHKPLYGGHFISINPDGTKEYDIAKKISARGSYESETKVRSVGSLDEFGMISHIQLDGNPSKFLQGHNVWGSDDHCLLACLWFCEVAKELNLFVSPFDKYRLSRGGFDVNRVDINYMFKMAHNSDVNQFLIALGDCGSTKYRKAMYQKGSVYFNKGSVRWSSVVYHKLEETQVRKKGHKIDLMPDDKKLLQDSCKDHFRWEFKFQSLELKDKNIYTGSDLAQYGVSKLYFEFLKNRIRINGNMQVTDKDSLNMPSRLKGTYLLWKSGADLRSCMSPRTFFRHKKELMLDYGIDIDSSERKTGSNVVKSL